MISRVLTGAGIRNQTFECPTSFLKALDDLEFGCVLLDIGLPGLSGLDLLDEIARRRPPFPVVMASGSVEMDDAITAFRRGAIHFLRKPFKQDEMLRVLREAAAVGAARAEAYQRERLAQQIRLTSRERQVLAAMSDGQQSKAIAWSLGLSVRTVDMHRSNILAKLSARNASQAVAIARTLNLLPEHKTAA